MHRLRSESMPEYPSLVQTSRHIHTHTLTPATTVVYRKTHHLFHSNQHCRQLHDGIEIHFFSTKHHLHFFTEHVEKPSKTSWSNGLPHGRLQGGTILPVPFLCSQHLQVLQGDGFECSGMVWVIRTLHSKQP